jgi:hypothetical protein
MPAKKKGNMRERRFRPIGFASQLSAPLEVRSQREPRGMEKKAQPVESRREPPSVTKAHGSAEDTDGPRPIESSQADPDRDSAESRRLEQTTDAGDSDATVTAVRDAATSATPTVAEDGAEGAFASNTKRLPGQRVRMGEALRIKGIDEHSVAEAYAGVVGMLKDKAVASDSVDKLLVDILKECSKHLEEDSKAAGGAPVQVRLIHNVARPQRNAAAAAPSAPSDSATNATEEDQPPTDESQV